MQDFVQKVFAVRHGSEDVRLDSRSGGAFTALSDVILRDHGVVYGCILDDQLRAVHVRATDGALRDRMRGSKYVQSDLSDTFKGVAVDLKAGQVVMFTGTPCQIAGLKAYLSGVDTTNLLCVDLLCHGVPSPVVLRDYLQWQNKTGTEISRFDFRNKQKYGWNSHIETVYYANGTHRDSRVYSTIFYGHCALRPSCYQCPYRSTQRQGDISLGDYWGVDAAAPGINDNKGVSCVLINSQKGEYYFNEIKEDITSYETRMTDCMQPALAENFPRPGNREMFWEDYRRRPFRYIAKKYGRYRLADQCKFVLKCMRLKLTKYRGK